MAGFFGGRGYAGAVAVALIGAVLWVIGVAPGYLDAVTVAGGIGVAVLGLGYKQVMQSE